MSPEQFFAGIMIVGALMVFCAVLVEDKGLAAVGLLLIGFAVALSLSRAMVIAVPQ